MPYSRKAFEEIRAIVNMRVGERWKKGPELLKQRKLVCVERSFRKKTKMIKNKKQEISLANLQTNDKFFVNCRTTKTC